MLESHFSILMAYFLGIHYSTNSLYFFFVLPMFLKISNCHTFSLLTLSTTLPPPWLTPPQPLPQLNPSKSLVEVVRSSYCWPSQVNLPIFHWIRDYHHLKKHHCTILASFIRYCWLQPKRMAYISISHPCMGLTTLWSVWMEGE